MKTILCFIYDGFADFETVLVCSYINEVEDYRVFYISYKKSPVRSAGGLTIIPDKTVAEISQKKDIDGILIPGGGLRVLKPELEDLVKKLNHEKKLIAAICAGPEFLVKMGILKGIKYTTSKESKQYEENNEVDPFPRDTYIDTRVIKDGNIITAKGYAFTDFALEIWDWFNLYEYEDEKEECKKQFTPA